MGSTARAHLAYGYDLGSAEDFLAAQRTEHGSPDLPWLGEDEDFPGDAEGTLLASVGFTDVWSNADGDYFDRQSAAKDRVGVDFAHAGGDEVPGWVLYAKGSERSVAWSETMVLDPHTLTVQPNAEQWNMKLDAALKALGITPTQDDARWLVFPSYG